MTRCPTCADYIYDGEKHTCPAAFLLWRPDYGETEDDARRIHASSASAAAEQWAERNDADSAEYGIVGGSDATVCVRCPDGKTRTYIVSGEAVPQYHARRVMP